MVEQRRQRLGMAVVWCVHSMLPCSCGTAVEVVADDRQLTVLVKAPWHSRRRRPAVVVIVIIIRGTAWRGGRGGALSK
ncbi:hypothetical protein GGR56DRAFT_650545 [Xylariaceae sp. FL0804]|nr:hypothetical protein GGR56DRAFT_650545 [Xylariaceae sp. FL0804]